MKSEPSFFHRIKYQFLALSAGALLASLIQVNSYLAIYSSSLYASWVVHGLGAVAACIIVLFVTGILQKKHSQKTETKAPIWAYLGGIPGAFAVILATFAIGEGLSLFNMLSLSLFGQVLFGMLIDHFCWFHTKKQPFSLLNLFITSLFLVGCCAIIYEA